MQGCLLKEDKKYLGEGRKDRLQYEVKTHSKEILKRAPYKYICGCKDLALFLKTL
jgi:hypothetical protein